MEKELYQEALLTPNLKKSIVSGEPQSYISWGLYPEVYPKKMLSGITSIKMETYYISKFQDMQHFKLISDNL